MNNTIENLKKLKSFHNGSYGADIDKAIKALEQEPCEDAVSREEAFEGLNSLNGTAELDMAFEVIEKLPSVTPIHIDRTVQDFVDKCRECGREKVLDKISKEIKGFSKYYLETEKVLEIIDKYKE